MTEPLSRELASPSETQRPVSAVRSAALAKQAAVRIYALFLLVVVLWTGCMGIAYLARSVFWSMKPDPLPKSKTIGPSPRTTGPTTATSKSCLACHGPGGAAAKKPVIVRHPEEPLKALHMAPVTCLTCHVPHGPPPDNASRTLRAGVAERACAPCHTTQAETRFLYYHSPEKRKR